MNRSTVSRPNAFASGTLDRASHRRQDDEWLQEARTSQSSRVVLVWRSQSLVRMGDEPRIETLTPAIRLPDMGPLGENETLVLLGLDDETAVFAVDLSHLDDPIDELGLGDEVEVMDLRQVAGVLDEASSSMLAYARAMMSWRQRHRFCGLCGAPTRSTQAGHVLVCTDESCGAESFPRTDPAVIMLVVDGDRCLLGRQASWPQGIFSTLAGFVEPGESLEDAVRREVREETGIETGLCRYSSSQPWPFPSSLMLGFHAEYARGEVQVDGDELEDARWFTRQEILDRTVRLPPPLSIARRLVDDWLRGETGL